MANNSNNPNHDPTLLSLVSIMIHVIIIVWCTQGERVAIQHDREMKQATMNRLCSLTIRISSWSIQVSIMMMDLTSFIRSITLISPHWHDPTRELSHPIDVSHREMNIVCIAPQQQLLTTQAAAAASTCSPFISLSLCMSLCSSSQMRIGETKIRSRLTHTPRIEYDNHDAIVMIMNSPSESVGTVDTVLPPVNSSQ